MKELTKRQTEILLFIEKYIKENGFSPSVREIAGYFKISAKGAYDHILALVKKGFITMQSGKPRTIRILAKKRGSAL